MIERTGRRKVTVTWNKSAKKWFCDGDEFDKKAQAVKWGRAICRASLNNGVKAQLIVKNKNARICFENTYGADPRRSKG